MALVIAGDRSGVGKTTITLAILSFLIRHGFKVQSFKVGPDYIDPMFHHYVTGRPCRNLDSVLTSESYIKSCFSRHIQDVEFAIIEGVMGLFDGVRFPMDDPPQPPLIRGETVTDHAPLIRGETVTDSLYYNSYASTAYIARLLDLSVLLVIDCSRLSGSVAAIAHGFRSFDPELKIAGLILNRVGSDRHLELLTNALKPLNLPIFGVLRRQDNITIPDRHLGLVPTDELPHLNPLIDQLAHLARTCFNWDLLLPLLRTQFFGNERTTKDTENTEEERKEDELFLPHKGIFVKRKDHKKRLRIGVARDRAFSFYYQDNLDLLEELGAELIFWSPLQDQGLPDDINGLYFGGGFPEVFAKELSENYGVLRDVKNAILSDIPTYAECGGLMYLCESLIDFNGNSWPMVGVLPTTTVMSKQLTLGYKRGIVLQESPLFAAGSLVYGHEFHRSRLTNEPLSPLYHLWRYDDKIGEGIGEGWGLSQLHASYLHLHWGAYPEIPRRFLQNCDRV
jgi:cobyrinic acid a,c-diamide synthase